MAGKVENKRLEDDMTMRTITCFWRSDKLNFPYNNCIKGMVFCRHECHLVKLRMYCHPRWPAFEHSRLQRPRSFWSAEPVQRHSGLNGFVDTID